MKLTKPQAAVADWAIDPVVEHWVGEDSPHLEDTIEEGGSGVVYQEADMPVLDGLTLKLDHVPPQVLEDFLERIEVQYIDMASEHPHDETGGSIRAAENLSDKVREHLGDEILTEARKWGYQG